MKILYGENAKSESYTYALTVCMCKPEKETNNNLKPTISLQNAHLAGHITNSCGRKKQILTQASFCPFFRTPYKVQKTEWTYYFVL